MTEEISKIDRDIIEYIEISSNNDFSEVIKNDGRWSVFCNLSKIRESVLNWYDFDEDSSLLEVGAGFGALTGLFCEKCKTVVALTDRAYKKKAIERRYKHVNNLDVIITESEKVNINETFDYIVLVGTLELFGKGTRNLDIYSNYLKSLKMLLKEGGKIIIATENRLGLKYFCGSEDNYTHIPFDGINKYPNGTNCYTFSRNELNVILNKAGLLNNKFYYPMPDYKVTQVVYSQEFLPKTSVNERVIPYYLDKTTILAYENDLYSDIIENNLFEVMANSFIVECTLNGNFSNTIMATISADRNFQEQYITSIRKNDIVKKKNINNINGIYVVQNNLEYLKNKGLSVIETKIDGDSLVMPFVNAPTMSEYIGKFILGNKNEILEIMDRYYLDLKKAANIVDAKKNILLSAENENLEWGDIAEKVFIDMIPLNIFYLNKQFIYFDQEFSKENYPIKYVLFRAIFYLYHIHPELQVTISKKELYERYGICIKLWEVFREIERKFVKGNRVFEECKALNERYFIKVKDIYDNGLRLKEGGYNV